MDFNFDKIIERNNTNSVKYDLAEEYNKPADSIKMWVADMDFPTAPCVIDALKKKCEYGIFGYSCLDEEYFSAVQNWMKDRHNFVFEKEWLITTPGVIFAISLAIKALTKEGDGVLIQKPVYYPFYNAIRQLNRKVVNNPLVLKNGKYEIDFEDFEKKIKTEKPKLFLFCSPHNPGGRVWKKEELIKINEICLKNKVIVLSDEIHSDIVFEGNEHTVFANLSKEALENSIICTSPSKSFNLAGLQISNIFIANKEIREKIAFQKFITGYDEANIMGIVAATSAYKDGGEWFDGVKNYIWENIEFTKDFIENHCPKIKTIIPEGTYLVWLDFHSFDMSDKEICKIIADKAKIWLDEGNIFGAEGKKFMRINVACPRSILKEALERICEFFK